MDRVVVKNLIGETKEPAILIINYPAKSLKLKLMRTGLVFIFSHFQWRLILQRRHSFVLTVKLYLAKRPFTDISAYITIPGRKNGHAILQAALP